MIKIICAAPKSINASLVLDGVQLSVIAHVLILSNPVVVPLALLPDDDAILLLRGVTELVVPDVEPLLLNDLGEARIAVVQAAVLRGGEDREREASEG